MQTVTVAIVHTRPRKTLTRIFRPTVLQAFAGAETPFVRTRPRPTIHALGPPVVIRVPEVEQQRRTIWVKLTRTRPRSTIVRVEPPTALRTFSGPQVELTRTRPRKTSYKLAPPTVIGRARVDEDTIRVTLTRARPRRTINQLAPPIALRVFEGARVHLVRTLPRPTTALLRPPTLIVIPSVEQREETITVKLVRIRPPAVQAELAPPVETSPVVTRIRASLVQIRPRDTIARLNPIPPVSPARVVEEKIQVSLAQPSGFRRVHSKLTPPEVVLQTTLEMQTIRLLLARIRPQPTVALLRPPTVVAPGPSLAQQTLTVKLALQKRLDLPRTRYLLGRPLVLVITTPGVTWGEDIAATAVEEYDVAGTAASDQANIAATSVEGGDTAALESTIGEDMPATTVESEDKEAGT